MIRGSIDGREPIVYLGYPLLIDVSSDSLLIGLEFVPSICLALTFAFGFVSLLTRKFLFSDFNLVLDTSHGRFYVADDPAELRIERFPDEFPRRMEAHRSKGSHPCLMLFALVEDISGLGAELNNRLENIDHGVLQDPIVGVQARIPTDGRQILSNLLHHTGELIEILPERFRDLVGVS